MTASSPKASIPSAPPNRFTVYTDDGAFKIDAHCAERLGEFYAFFDKEEISQTIKSSLVARLFGAPTYRSKAVEARRHYRELIRLSSIQRIIVPRGDA